MDPEIIIKESNEQEIKYIDDAIVKYNLSKVPFLQEQPFFGINFVAKKQDQIVGGINAIMYCWKVLYVDILWVDEIYRGHRLGTQLLQKVENAAKAHECTLMHLDTFDFQAKDFYLKNGFEVFGVLSDCPPGHNRYYLKKNLIIR